MSTVIMQARDWGDWYDIKGWLDANAPGSYRLVHAVDSMPAAFEYPAEHQAALMEKLYGKAAPAQPDTAQPEPASPAAEPDQAPQEEPDTAPAAESQPVVKRTPTARANTPKK